MVSISVLFFPSYTRNLLLLLLLLKSVVLLNSSKKAYRLLLDDLVFAPCDAAYATYVNTAWITVCAFHIGCAYVVASGPKPAIAINGNIRAWAKHVIFNAVLSFGPAVRRPYAIPQRRQANIRKAIMATGPSVFKKYGAIPFGP